MFQFTRFASHAAMYSDGYLSVGFPIQKSPDQCLFASSRSFSQAITSFVAYHRQGIHHMLLVTLTL